MVSALVGSAVGSSGTIFFYKKLCPMICNNWSFDICCGRPDPQYGLPVAVIKKLKLEKRGEGVSICFDIIDVVVLSDFSGVWGR